MNKSDLIDTVQAVLENRKQAEAAINSIIFNIEAKNVIKFAPGKKLKESV